MKYRCAGYRKKACTYEADELWEGACPGCGRWHDVESKRDGSDGKNKESTLADAPSQKSEKRLSTGIADLDEILGGGFVFGSTVLWGGPPRSGKTTLTLQIANSVANETNPVLFVSKEQTLDAVITTAHRVKCKNPHVKLRGNEGDIEVITARAKELKPTLLILDSVQKIAKESGLRPADVVEHFIELAKELKNVTVLISQVGKDMTFAGAMSQEHDVDTVIYMGEYLVEEDKLRLCEGRKIEEDGHYRFLVLEKNRHSVDDQSLLFRMFDTGLSVVRKTKRRKSKLLLIRDDSDEKEEEKDDE